MSDAAERMKRLVRGGASPQETGWAEEGLLRACARAPLPIPQRGMGRVTRVGTVGPNGDKRLLESGS